MASGRQRFAPGVDRPLGPFERLGEKFPGVRFELAPGVPDADGSPAPALTAFASDPRAF